MIILLLLLSPMALAMPSKAPKPVSVNPSWPNSNWQAYVYEKAKDLPNPSDGKEFCPKGLTRENWVHLLAAMVKYESNFNPTSEYKENFKSSQTGDNVISTGLFQVSTGSLRGYGVFVSQEQLHDPYKNIDAALVIMKKWLKNDGVVANHTGTTWKGGARYWSVLRTTGKLSRVKQWMRPYCQ